VRSGFPFGTGIGSSKGRHQDNAFRAQEDGLGWPADRQGLQPSFDHFVAQPVGILAHCWTRCEVMLMRPIRFRLLPNVLVVARQSFVRQIFYTQNLLLLKSFERSEVKGRRHSRAAARRVQKFSVYESLPSPGSKN
jgi:hypothetical protein